VVVARVTSAHDYDDPGKPKIAWNDKAAREALVDALVRDALAVVAALGEQEPGLAEDAVGLLALIAGQDVELVDPTPSADRQDPASGEPRWRIARRVAPDRVISIVDTEARHAHKTVHRRQDGFKAHLAIEPDTGLVTACELTKAAGPGSTDAGVGIDLLTAETEQVQVLGDSAYATGQALAVLAETGHTPLVKPWAITPAVPGGFTINDFTIDLAARTATCPAGKTVPINAGGGAQFGSRCTSCPLAARCTTSKRGRKLTIGEHFELQHQHRQRAQDAQWQADYRQHRPMVERSIAWLTARGNRKLRYRGVAKNNAWLHHRTAALNLRRMLNLGLDLHQGAWTLA